MRYAAPVVTLVFWGVGVLFALNAGWLLLNGQFEAAIMGAMVALLCGGFGVMPIMIAEDFR